MYVFSLLVVIGLTRSCNHTVNDSNIQAAVKIWIEDKTAARSILGDISTWNVSSVTNMNGLFGGIKFFNEDITNWDTSSVTDMSSMFRDSISFNQNIGNWNTKNVVTMESMFEGASTFNQDLSNWETGQVQNMKFMFQRAFNFKNNISLWNVSGVHEYGFLQMFQGSGYHFDDTYCNIINYIAQNFSQKNRYWSGLDARLHNC